MTLWRARLPGGTDHLTAARVWVTVFALLLWLLWLFLQPGNPLDEGEHLHTAWMVAKGLAPGQDFFQHHTPLLWWVLAPWFLAGGSGPASAWAGRVLVVLLALASHRLLGAIRSRSGSRPRSEGSSSGERSRWPLGLAETTLVLVILAAPNLLVIRPETLGLALFFGGILGWVSGASPPMRASASGVLLGLSVLASPRFLVACLGLVLFEWIEGRLRTTGELATLGLGGALALVMPFLLLPGYGWGYLRFTLEFSSQLQQVAEKGESSAPVLTALLGVPLLFLAVQASRLRSARTLAAGAVSWLLVAGLSKGLAGGGLYPQDLAPVVAWSLVLLALWEGRSRAHQELPIRALALAGAVLFAVSRLVLLVGGGGTVATSVQLRREMLEAARTRDRPVLMTPAQHPISWPDADFYWLGDQACRTMGIYRERSGEERWPPCDPARVALTLRPGIVEPELLGNDPEAESVVTELLNSGYRARHDVLVAPAGPTEPPEPEEVSGSKEPPGQN